MQKPDIMWITDALLDIETGCKKHGLADVAETIRQAVLEYSAAMSIEPPLAEVGQQAPKLRLVHSKAIE